MTDLKFGIKDIRKLLSSYTYALQYTNESQPLFKEEIRPSILDLFSYVILSSFEMYKKILRETSNDNDKRTLKQQIIEIYYDSIEHYVKNKWDNYNENDFSSNTKSFRLEKLLNNLKSEKFYKIVKYLLNDDNLDQVTLQSMESNKIEIRCSTFSKNVLDVLCIHKIDDRYFNECFNQYVKVLVKEHRKGENEIHLNDKIKKRIDKILEEKDKEGRKEEKLVEKVDNNVVFIDILRQCATLKWTDNVSIIAGVESNCIHFWILQTPNQKAQYYTVYTNGFIYCHALSTTGQFLFYSVRNYIYIHCVKERKDVCKWFLAGETVLQLELYSANNSYMLTLSDFNIVRLYQTDKLTPIRIFHFKLNILRVGFMDLHDHLFEKKNIANNNIWFVDEMNDLFYLCIGNTITESAYEETEKQKITNIGPFNSLTFARYSFVWDFRQTISILDLLDSRSIITVKVEEVIDSFNFKYFNRNLEPESEFKLTSYNYDGNLLYMVFNEQAIVAWKPGKASCEWDLIYLDCKIATLYKYDYRDTREDGKEKKSSNLIAIGYKEGKEVKM